MFASPEMESEAVGVAANSKRQGIYKYIIGNRIVGPGAHENMKGPGLGNKMEAR